MKYSVILWDCGRPRLVGAGFSGHYYSVQYAYNWSANVARSMIAMGGQANTAEDAKSRILDWLAKQGALRNTWIGTETEQALYQAQSDHKNAVTAVVEPTRWRVARSTDGLHYDVACGDCADIAEGRAQVEAWLDGLG